MKEICKMKGVKNKKNEEEVILYQNSLKELIIQSGDCQLNLEDILDWCQDNPNIVNDLYNCDEETE